MAALDPPTRYADERRMSENFDVIGPADGSVVVTRPWATERAIDDALSAAAASSSAWRDIALDERVALVLRMVDLLLSDETALGEELTLQMGRPSRYAAGELAGFAERARTMCQLAEAALAPHVPATKAGFVRRIERVPLGVVLVLSPWNYPWLTAVNAVVPALLAGNAVVLKHSDQTPLVAERFVAAARRAGFPGGVFDFVHATHEQVARMVRDSRVDHVAFTGSVEGGRAVQGAARDRFIDIGLELGGSDGAYVVEDADIPRAAAGLAEGAYFNSGQSCCGIERIFVAASRYDAFCQAFRAEAEALVLGDPREASTTLGPMVRARNAASFRGIIEDARRSGARDLLPPATSARDPYVSPVALLDTEASMPIRRLELFGPGALISPVAGDDAAIESINASPYGLTAAVYTPDLARAEQLAGRLDVGTVFANRCDYLDPELAWTGTKDSGRGHTLSALGFEGFTRPKSLHLRALP